MHIYNSGLSSLDFLLVSSVCFLRWKAIPNGKCDDLARMLIRILPSAWFLLLGFVVVVVVVVL